MKYLDSSLGKPLPEKSYAENCEFTARNIWVRERAPFITDQLIAVVCPFSECHRYILPGARTGVVWKGVDLEGLLVLLGAFSLREFFSFTYSQPVRFACQLILVSPDIEYSFRIRRVQSPAPIS